MMLYYRWSCMISNLFKGVALLRAPGTWLARAYIINYG
jgi:hypothetical protein